MSVRKIIALYLRISKKDEDKEEDLESNSIGNQRGILLEFLQRNLDCAGYEVREFIDDGYSGTSMDRPAMNELLILAKQGLVEMIIVKDLSRFARNYIEIGNYTERIFPYIGVRFISVNDNYDSTELENGMPRIDVAFKGIIHDYYCKELSKKMKAALRQQVQNGRCIVSKAPYGYWKSKEQKGLLIIDEETAPIVKNIFQMYADGMSSYAISKYLNQSGVESPNRRLVKAGLVKYSEEYTKGLYWTCGVVLSMLRNQVYVGDLIGNKTERIKVCGREIRKNDKEQWIIVPNTHEPIIDRVTFAHVQKLLEAKKPAPQNKKRNYQTFRGVLVCGYCNAVLTKSGENKGIAYYICAKCRIRGKGSMIIHSDFLEESVLKELPRHEKTNSLDECEVKSDLPEVNVKSEKHKKNIPKIDLADVYEKYAEGLITKEEFIHQRTLAQEQTEQESKPKQSSVISMQQKNKDVNVLSRELIAQYISKIIVYGQKKIQIEWLDTTLDQVQ